MKTVSLALVGVLGLAWAGTAEAHVDLTYPPMRYNYTDGGQKVGPCGAGIATGAVTTFAPGATITVTWDETINHPGHFRISLDPDGGDDAFVDPTGYDSFYVAPSVLADNITDLGGSAHSQEITLPATECELCTLQLIQVMTDKPPWGPGGGDDLYYWCADISIQDGGGTGGSPGAGGGATGGSGAGAAGAGASEPITAESEDEGCSVSGGPRTSGSRGSSSAVLLLGALGWLAARRRSGRAA